MLKQESQIAKVHRVSVRSQERERLMQLVLSLSHEVEQLREDNLQLRAALQIYRELAKNKPVHPLNPPTGMTPAPRV